MLSGQEIDKLAELLSSTLGFSDLERYVHAATGDRLFTEFVSQGKPLEITIFDLLNRLEERGQTSIFLAHVYAKRPQRPDIRAEIVKLFPDAATVPETKIELSAQIAGAPQIDAPTNAIVPGLERNVRPNLARLDISDWKARLIEIQWQVCRMELDGLAIGSGFLVGPDAVLTNWRVFEVARKAGKIGQLGCRFNTEGSDGKPVQLIMLHADGCIDFSSCSGAEMASNPEGPLPSPDELDYALLRLASRAGEEQVESKARGWIVLPQALRPLSADTSVLIVQQPVEPPMKVALDTEAVIGLNGNGTRIRYRIQTDPGSCGSPVFTMDWDIVALHQCPDFRRQDILTNQGVPIELIRKRIESNGLGAVLGA